MLDNIYHGQVWGFGIFLFHELCVLLCFQRREPVRYRAARLNAISCVFSVEVLDYI